MHDSDPNKTRYDWVRFLILGFCIYAPGTVLVYLGSLFRSPIVVFLGILLVAMGALVTLAGLCLWVSFCIDEWIKRKPRQ